MATYEQPYAHVGLTIQKLTCELQQMAIHLSFILIRKNCSLNTEDTFDGPELTIVEGEGVTSFHFFGRANGISKWLNLQENKMSYYDQHVPLVTTNLFTEHIIPLASLWRNRSIIEPHCTLHLKHNGCHMGASLSQPNHKKIITLADCWQKKHSPSHTCAVGRQNFSTFPCNQPCLWLESGDFWLGFTFAFKTTIFFPGPNW